MSSRTTARNEERSPAEGRAPPGLRRKMLGLALAIAVLFGGSMAAVHRLTDLSAPIPVPSPSPELAVGAPRADPPAAPRAAVLMPLAPPASAGKPAPGPVRGSPPGSAGKPASSPRASSIEVSFRLDPRLTRGLAMGDRWVSPPQYTSAALPGADATIVAKALARDASGRALKDVTPVWTPADPEMVAVAPDERGAVSLTVKRGGRSDVLVASGGAAKKLTVAAVRERGLWRIDIAQR